ncbi:conserved protein of unknown function [Pseudomonas marincola]|uniref:Uncharacterized protein n=1 Tax=Pseudomonas marincola TaxID=437900 RepID=A0A1I7BJ78_9PSED|nr:conserved protein of unknown function [Pseudomonas marincola]SFT87238.1 hypothetical protein SAMN05216264_105206 [Pseudomonas marincola]
MVLAKQFYKLVRLWNLILQRHVGPEKIGTLMTPNPAVSRQKGA